MPTIKFTAPWALCLALTAMGVSAAPETEIPTAPSSEPASPVTPITSDDAPPPTFIRAEALNLGQLESIQAETVLYEAQLARTKALNELQKNGYGRSLDVSFTSPPPYPDNKTEDNRVTHEAMPPQIIEITGNSKGFTAVLALSNGNQITVMPGNRIPGTEYVVKRIDLNEVVVTGKNRSLMSLSFSG